MVLLACCQLIYEHPACGTQKTAKMSHPHFHLLPCHITPLCCGSTVSTVLPLPALKWDTDQISILTFENWIQVREANYSDGTLPVKMLLRTRPLTDLIEHRLSVFICVPLMLNLCWSQLIREISLICAVLVNRRTWRKTEACRTVVIQPVDCNGQVDLGEISFLLQIKVHHHHLSNLSS